MGVLDRRVFDEMLMAEDDGPRVSLYLPTHRGGREVRQAAIRLKNLLAAAAEQLTTRGESAADAKTLLAPAADLVNRQDYWEHQLDGLAIFLDGDGMRDFRCPRRFDELCYVNGHFHLKPLLPVLRRETAFHLLALSLKKVRLYEVTTDRLDELALDGIPESLEDALGHDLDEPTLQMHTGGPAGPGRDSGVFHGHGAGDDDRDAEVVRFLQLVDRGLRDHLQDDAEPVVLCGVKELVHRFHDLSRHPGLVPGGVSGHHDSLDPRRLHAEAWEVARPVLDEDAERAAARFTELRGTPLASAEVAVVGPALAGGRVESLLVSAEQRFWGRLEEDGTPRIHDERRPWDVELLDRLAALGLKRGTEVFVRRSSRLPDGVALAAVMRF